ncbi:MAG: group II intron reverse transcriptase/maturase [Syntrophorhabdus sp.]
MTTASERSKPLTAMLMEEVVRKENLLSALKRVRANKGSPGVDGMTVEELPGYVKEHWPRIRKELLRGDYIPQPVKRVTIPKPGGGTRELGVPTTLDRFIQQAILQVLTPLFELTFSPRSYGFRPGKSAHQAVEQAKKYIAEGYAWVVDCDLERFFDRVNHDILMGRLAKRIEDKRLLKLIRRYLQAGVMVHGVVQERWEGTPQGGPLSPLLSNLLLDELDKELEQRGHRFCRYADDCNVYVKTQRAGQRVFDSIEQFLWKRLKLKVNREKSAVAPCHERGFLGFSFTKGKVLKIKLSSKALRGVKHRIKAISRRSRGISLAQMIHQLTTYLKGWMQYYRLVETPTVLRDLDSWIQRRLRCYMAKQWIKNCHTRYKNLVAMGIYEKDARPFAASRKGPWAMSNMKPLKVATPNRFFEELGLVSLSNQHRLVGKTS